MVAKTTPTSRTAATLGALARRKANSTSVYAAIVPTPPATVRQLAARRSRDTPPRDAMYSGPTIAGPTRMSAM
jgi:hypothetical protein